MSETIQVRKCHGIEEFQRCVELQKEIWGEADIEVEPATLFVVAAETGGQVLGAFDGQRMVGYTLALVGCLRGTVFLHSHMTGVVEEYRNRGVGRALKLFQREEALGRGIRLVVWTFDPLETRNAHFNLNRLGAISRKYLPNLYGVTSSPLHRGLPTDRLWVEWPLDSRRVVAALSGLARPGGPATGPSQEALGVNEWSCGSARGRRVASDDAPAKVAVPAQIEDWKRGDVARVARVQEQMREAFTGWFARGYAAVGVQNTAAGTQYLLAPWSDF